MAKRKPLPILPEKLCLSYLRKSSMLFMHFYGDGLLRYANPAAVRAFRLSRKHGFEFLPEIVRTALLNGETPSPLRVEYDGRYYDLSFYRGAGIIVEGNDVTELCSEIHRLRLDARHHALTQLPTRNYFVEMLSNSLARIERSGKEERLAVYFMDIDKFKKINTDLGHERADRILIEAAARLKKAARATDFIAHRSGDEFLGLSFEIEDEEDALVYAGRVYKAFEEPFIVGSESLSIGISIGIALSKGGKKEKSPTALLKEANDAMFRSKRFGHPAFSHTEN